MTMMGLMMPAGTGGGERVRAGTGGGGGESSSSESFSPSSSESSTASGSGRGILPLRTGAGGGGGGRLIAGVEEVGDTCPALSASNDMRGTGGLLASAAFSAAVRLCGSSGSSSSSSCSTICSTGCRCGGAGGASTGGGAGGGGRGLLCLVIDKGRLFFSLWTVTESGWRGAEGGRVPGVPGVARAESSGVNVAALRGYMLES